MFIITSYRGQGKGSKTDILKLIIFHKIPTVEFDFAAISVIVYGGRAQLFTLIYFNIPFSFGFTKELLILTLPFISRFQVAIL
jgi:hypothetical protein